MNDILHSLAIVSAHQGSETSKFNQNQNFSKILWIERSQLNFTFPRNLTFSYSFLLYWAFETSNP